MNKPFKAPKGSKRIFDLINCETYKIAFYDCFKDTLVCDSLDIAHELAYGKRDGRCYRCVTLDGIVINTNGIMAGGGKPISGKMGN